MDLIDEAEIITAFSIHVYVNITTGVYVNDRTVYSVRLALNIKSKQNTFYSKAFYMCCLPSV